MCNCPEKVVTLSLDVLTKICFCYEQFFLVFQHIFNEIIKFHYLVKPFVLGLYKTALKTVTDLNSTNKNDIR